MKPFLLTIFIACLGSSAFSQIQFADSEIVKTMQRLADTTIIVQYPNNWDATPRLYFLSKKGDTINTYVFKKPGKFMKIKSIVPTAMARTILTNDFNNNYKEPIGINRFFTIKDTPLDTLSKFWKDVMNLKPWEIKDDSIDGEGCPVVKGKGVMTIDDAGGIYILLVTKTFIKPLNFYAPEDFEKHCPGRKGRQAAIKLSTMFYNVFKE